MSHHSIGYEANLRRRGYRVTPQRQLILDAICEGDGHSTPDEIYTRVRARAPSVNLATVYRNLDFLCEMRLVVAAQIGGQMRYEIAAPTPHHHLICRQCDKVQELKHEEVQALMARIDRDHKFTVDMDHIAFYGLCSKCRRKSE